MEHPLQPQTEVDDKRDRIAEIEGLESLPSWHDCASGCVREPVKSSDIPTGRLVDDKISDVVRMTVATCRIVLESDGCPLDFQVKMQNRVLRMLGVKERRS
jgi:hypothetical protein